MSSNLIPMRPPKRGNLVLSRRVREEVVLEIVNPDGTPGEIVVALISAGHGRGQISFCAPPHVRIRRRELADKAAG